MFKKYSIYILAAALAASSLMWYTTSLKLEASAERVVAAENKIKQVQAECKAAAAQAEAKNLVEVKEIETKYEKKADEADARLTELRKQFNANLLQYASRPSGSSGTVRLSSTSPIAASGYTASDSTEISISFEDAGICAENTARLQAVKEWADKINK